MNTRTVSIDSTKFLKAAARPGGLDRFVRRTVLKSLAALEHGQLVVEDADGRSVFGKVCEAFPRPIRIDVQHPRFYTDVAFGGSIGAGEAYMHDCWRVDDLTGLLRLFVANRDALDKVDSGLAWLSLPLQKLYHLRKP